MEEATVRTELMAKLTRLIEMSFKTLSTRLLMEKEELSVWKIFPEIKRWFVSTMLMTKRKQL